LEENVAAQIQKSENTAVGIRQAVHVASSILKKLALTSPTSGGLTLGRYSLLADSGNRPQERYYTEQNFDCVAAWKMTAEEKGG
jgi:hypothetical protein